MTERNGRNRGLISEAEHVAEAMERAVHLNGAGAKSIRDLTNVLRNVEAADAAMELIADRYERLVSEVDQLLQGNLALQKEMVNLFKRVTKLEKKP